MNVCAAATTTAHARGPPVLGFVHAEYLDAPRTDPGDDAGRRRRRPMPSITSSDQPIARTTARGRGCSDRKASATKTKGITVSPTARPIAALGSTSLLEPSFVASATSPSSNAQNARTSTSVATRIARHFLAGESG